MEPRDEFRAKVARFVSREAALMLTDIVGYTKLAQSDPPRALAVLDDQNKVIKESIEKHGGIVASVLGDAHLVEFCSAADSVRCALDIQVRLASRNLTLPEDRHIYVRIGVHYATVTPVGQELRGDGLKLLSKIGPKAPPGGICLSEEVHRQIKDQAFETEDLGMQRLEGWPAAEHLYLVSSAGPAQVGPQLKATQVKLVKDSSLLASVATLEPQLPSTVLRAPLAVRLESAEPSAPEVTPRKARSWTPIIVGLAALVLIVGYLKVRSPPPESPPVASAAPAPKAPPVPDTPRPSAPPPSRAVLEPPNVPAPKATTRHPVAIQPERPPAPPPERAPRAEAEKTKHTVASVKPATQPVEEKAHGKGRHDSTLNRLQKALARVEKLPRAQQKNVLPDLAEWKRVERMMAEGKRGVDVDHKVLARLEKELEKTAR